MIRAQCSVLMREYLPPLAEESLAMDSQSYIISNISMLEMQAGLI